MDYLAAFTTCDIKISNIRKIVEEIEKKRSQLIAVHGVVGLVNTFGCVDKMF